MSNGTAPTMQALELHETLASVGYRLSEVIAIYPPPGVTEE